MAALMRDLEDGSPAALAAARADLAALHPAVAGAFVVGLTGPPGAGKSTLVDALVTRWRARGERVGVVAVDPSSPLTGGAVLGDRVRMQGHATDDGVFIRSLAARGAEGGLSRSAGDVVAVLAAGGFRTVAVETVGVGQSEIEVASLADVVVVVTAPGQGDGVQAMKAGILEIADVLVVNKGDHPGAERAVADLEGMLELRRVTAGPAPADVPILRTVATTGAGVDELVAALDAARASEPADVGVGEGESGGGAVAGARAQPGERRRRRAMAAIQAAVVARTRDAAAAALADPALADMVDAVAARREDPRAAADALMVRLGWGILKG
jgi:LAO/AO transport system kinase